MRNAHRGKLRMSISEWGAVGEVVGAVAVLVTLVHLTLQIREARRAMVATTQQNISDTSVDLFASLSTSTALAEAFARAARGEALTPGEKQQVSGWWSAVLRHAENMHYQYEQGMLPADLLEPSGRRIATGLLQMPFALRSWRVNASDHRPEFVAWLEQEIERKRVARTDESG
jgi:hypothetical protein